jgi:hypothetical protein
MLGCETPASVSWEEESKNEIGSIIKFAATANMRFVGSTASQDHVGCDWNTSDRDISRITECVKDVGVCAQSMLVIIPEGKWRYNKTLSVRSS